VGVAKITPGGEVIREQPGEVVLSCGTCRLSSRLGLSSCRTARFPRWPGSPANNDIDRLVLAQLRELRIKPADLAPDHVFLRRAYLDALGVLPTPEETRAFLADSDTRSERS
jgi:hypothetical protein